MVGTQDVLSAAKAAGVTRFVHCGTEAALIACERLWRVAPLPGQPPLTRFTFWVSSQECTIDIDKARRELGYRPVKGRAEGLAELAASR